MFTCSCKVCPNWFIDLIQLIDHCKICHSEHLEFTCERCCKDFPKFDDFILHLYNKHHVDRRTIFSQSYELVYINLTFTVTYKTIPQRKTYYREPFSNIQSVLNLPMDSPIF